MLAPEFLPVWGGVGTYIIELIKYLCKNIEFHVVTPFRTSIGIYNVSSDEYDYSKIFCDDINIHFISEASDTFFYNIKFQYAVMKHVPRLVKEEKIDIIHSHTSHMPDLLLTKNIEIPIVTTIHTTIKGQREGTKMSGSSFLELELSEKATLLMYPMLRLIEELYFMKERHYITVSYWFRDQLLKQYSRLANKNITVIHNGVDTNFFSPKSKSSDDIISDKDVVLFTGRLISAKGINVLIESIPKVLKEYKDVIFIFVGPGNIEPYVKRLKKIGVSKSNLKFLGYLKKREDLLRYYRSASVFVAPTFYDNLPIRVLEAMACEVAVIASNVCAIPEVIKNNYNGILIPPGDINALADSLIYLLENPEERKRISKNAYQTIKTHFDWNVLSQKYYNFYRRVIGENS